MNRRNAAFYLRVSTLDQSYERQASDLKAISGDFYVPEDAIYADKLSGYKKHEDRPALNRLLDDITTDKKKFHTLFLWETSRLSRDPDHAREILTRIIDSGVQVYIHNIKMSTHNLDGSRNLMFHIVFTLMSEFANVEARSFKERVRSGQIQSIRQGGTGGGNRLNYGYTRDGNKNLVIHPEEAKWVKQIFQWSLEGLGNKQIVHKLNEAGVKTKMNNVYGDKAPGNTFREGTVQKILNNQIYIGKRTWEGETHPVPAIIAQEMYDDVQDAREARKSTNGERGRWNYLFTDILFCGVCGCKMVGRHKESGRTSHYVCISKRGSNGCKNVAIGIEALESCIWNKVKHNPKMFDTLKSSGNELKDTEKKIEAINLELDILKKRIREKETEMEGWNLLLAKGRIKEAQYDTNVGKLDKAIQQTEKKMSELKKELKSLARKKERLSNQDWYYEAYKQVTGDRYSVKELLHKLIGKVIVTSVESHHNNTQWLVSVFLQDLLSPISIVVIAKARWERDEDFMLPIMAHSLGQSKYKYRAVIPVDNPSLLSYDEKNRLIGTAKKVIKACDKDWANMSPQDKKIFTGTTMMYTVPMRLTFNPPGGVLVHL